MDFLSSWKTLSYILNTTKADQIVGWFPQISVADWFQDLSPSPTCFQAGGPSGCAAWRLGSGASGLRGPRSGSCCWTEGCWGPAGSPSWLQRYRPDRKPAENKGYASSCNVTPQVFRQALKQEVDQETGYFSTCGDTCFSVLVGSTFWASGLFCLTKVESSHSYTSFTMFILYLFWLIIKHCLTHSTPCSDFSHI